MKNLTKEHENKEDEEFKEYTYEINETNASKFSKGKSEEDVMSSLLAKHFSLKLIKAVIFSITPTNKK